MENVRFPFHATNTTGIEVFRLRLQNTRLKSMPYKKFTKLTKAIGSENVGLERTIFIVLALEEVNSLSRIPLGNKEKFRALPQTENHFAQVSGGGKGTPVEPSLPIK